MKTGLCGFTIGAAEYYRTFPVLEVQQTFYDPPPMATINRWRVQAPPRFEFTMKAWQVITHARSSRTYRRLKSPMTEKQREEAGSFRPTPTVLAAWEKSVACARALRATAILLQCPASFKPADENVANMRAFFAAIERPANARLLWEPRGDWPDPLIKTLCTDLDLVHVVDPFVRPTVTPNRIYWRLHGNGSHYASYTGEELAQLLDWLGPDHREAYVMFNNIPRAGDAKRFMEMVARARGSRAP